MPRNRVVGVLSAALLVMSPAVLVQTNATAQAGGDVLVSNGSPTAPFSANKQNEPAIAVDANHPNVLAAGSNDNIDMEACNAGTDNTARSRRASVSPASTSRSTPAQLGPADLHGLTARGCVGVAGRRDPPCSRKSGRSGRCPDYAEHGLVSDGDPALAFGPAPDANGGFSWDNGSRLYYANLASNVPGPRRAVQGLRGDRRLAHRRPSRR